MAAWSLELVPGRPGLHSETLPRKKKNEELLIEKKLKPTSTWSQNQYMIQLLHGAHFPMKGIISPVNQHSLRGHSP